MALFHGPTSRHGRTRRGDAGVGSVAAAAMRPRASCGLREERGREGEEGDDGRLLSVGATSQCWQPLEVGVQSWPGGDDAMPRVA